MTKLSRTGTNQPIPDRSIADLIPDREGDDVLEPDDALKSDDACRPEGLKSGSAYHSPNGPGAYFITFTTYGTWLPGDLRSFVDCEHNCPNESRLESHPERLRSAEHTLKHPPLVLNVPQRQRVLDAILEVCRFRRWWAHAVHVRTNHVHIVVSAPVKPEKIMTDFKAYSTRGLRHSGLLASTAEPIWTKHGSTRYLWNDDQFYAALTYVRDGQGERVAYEEGPIPTPRSLRSDDFPRPDPSPDR